jgi:hypothetical protein
MTCIKAEIVIEIGKYTMSVGSQLSQEELLNIFQ